MFLFRTRFTGHLRDGGVTKPRLTLRDAAQTLRQVAANRVLMAMIILGGLGSFFVGASLQSAMPVFASQLGGGGGGAYGVLLFALGAGGVVGGLLLEATGWIRPDVKAALLSTVIYGLATLGFALTRNYPLAIALLVVGGVANMAAMSIGQTVVQLMAAPAERGRVIGVYSMSSGGLRAGSGFTVGLLGAAIGIHASLSASAAAMCVATGLTAWYLARGRTGGRQAR